MKGQQASGTPAHAAQWDGNERSPVARFTSDSWRTFLQTGTGLPSGVVNYSKVWEWFKPRYDAWRANRDNVITADDVFKLWPQLFLAADKAGSPHVQFDPDALKYATVLGNDNSKSSQV